MPQDLWTEEPKEELASLARFLAHREKSCIRLAHIKVDIRKCRTINSEFSKLVSRALTLDMVVLLDDRELRYLEARLSSGGMA